MGVTQTVHSEQVVSYSSLTYVQVEPTAQQVLVPEGRLAILQTGGGEERDIWTIFWSTTCL